MGHMRWHFLVPYFFKSSDQEGLKFCVRHLSSAGASLHRCSWSSSVEGNTLPSRYVCRLLSSSSQVCTHHSLQELRPWSTCRRFSVAADVQHTQTEYSNQSEGEISLEVDLEKTSTEVGIEKFFQRAKAIARVSDLLRTMTPGREMHAFAELNLIYDTALVTQVLRTDISCDMALSFFHWLKSQEGFKHNAFTYGVMKNILGRAGRVDEMLSLFDEMQSEGCKVTSVTRSSIMIWISRAKDRRSVIQLWEKMQQEGTKPSVAIYTTFIDHLVKAKQYKAVTNIYKQMLKEDCLPSARTYTLFIQHLVDAGKIEAASKILSLMQNMRVVPNRVTYEFLINGYAKAGNMKMVMNLLDEMRERFHRPSKRLFSAVKGLQDAGRSEEAKRLAEDIWPELPAEDIKDRLNGSNRNESGHIEGQFSDDFEGDAADGSGVPDCLISEWRSVTSTNVGFDVNAFAQVLQTWNPLVEKALERGNVEWQSSLVLEILRRLRNLQTSWPFFHWVKDRSGFKHDNYSCMLMIQRILKSETSVVKKASLVEELFEGMEKSGLKFSVPMFNMLIRYYVDAGEIDRALNTFNRIREFHLEPNRASYASMIQGLARDRQGRKAMDLLEVMQEAGFQLDGITCAELINCLGLAGKTESAYSLFRKMSESGINPGAEEYKAVIAMYNRVGNQKMALELYEEMRGAGISPTQGMYEVIAKVLRKANRTIDIKVLGEQRKSLDLFGGKKKVLQENLLQVLSIFTENIVQRKTVSAAEG